MTRATTWMALLLALAGCGGLATAAGEPATADDVADWRGDSEHPLATRMRELAERLEEAGLEPGSIDGQGFLASEQSVTEELRLEQGQCATIVALATSGVSDIDATLYDPSGQVLAEDREPDAHPTIQVCGGERGRRVYYRVHAYEGAGAYLYAAFVGEREAFAEAARIVGGQPGVVAEEGAGDTDERLQDLERGVARRGFEPLRPPDDLKLARDQRVRVPLPVKESHCYTVAAFSHRGIEDLNLRVLDEMGEERVRDESGARNAQAQLCVDRDGDFSVEVHAAAGEGSVTFATYEGPEASVGGESGLWLGRRPSAVRSRAPLEQTLGQVQSRARAAGWKASRGGVEGRLVQAEAVAHPVPVEAGGCTLVVAAGGKGIGRLRLRVVDEQGRTLSRRASNGPAVTARVCADDGARAQAHLVAGVGSGKYALETLRKAAPSGQVPSAAGAEDVGPLLDALEEAEASGWSLAGEVRALSLPASVPLAVEACEQVHVVAAGLGGSVGVELRRGERIAARRGGRVVQMPVCPREGAPPPELVLRGQQGTEQAFVLRFRR